MKSKLYPIFIAILICLLFASCDARRTEELLPAEPEETAQEAAEPETKEESGTSINFAPIMEEAGVTEEPRAPRAAISITKTESGSWI